MQRLLLLFLSLFSSMLVPAQNVSGLWKGSFMSDATPFAGRYQFEVLLFQDGVNLSGFTYSSNSKGTFYAVCELRGKLFATHMVLTETKMVFSSISKAEEVRQQHLLFFTGGDIREVNGDWRQTNKKPFQLYPEQGTSFLKKEDNTENSALLYFLEKEQLIGVKREQPVIDADSILLHSRMTELRDTVDVTQEEIQLSLFDDGLTDGDSVSVFLNGKLVLKQVSLSSQSQQFKLKFPPGMSSVELFLFAENEGSIAPNTGLLRITDGDAIKEVRFRSSFKKSAGILLRKK